MPRSRNIKHSFFSNDELADIDPLGRLLFIGMWTIADYKGDFEWREKRIKAQLLPYDNCDIKKIAINLDKSGFIRFYSDGVKIYAHVDNFTKHQNPHKNEREKGSEIPGFNESLRQAVDLKGLTINRDKNRSNQEDSASAPADSCSLNPDSCSLIPDTSVDSQENTTTPAEEVFNYWQSVMNHKSAKLDDKRKKLINAALKTGYSVNDLRSAILGCSLTPHNMGANDRHQRYDGLHIILKPENIDRFIGNAKAPPVDPNQKGWDAFFGNTVEKTDSIEGEVLGHE